MEMMNITKRLYSEINIQNIADAIREKTGSNEIYQVRDMPQAILDIPTASGGLDLTTSLVLSSDKSSTTGPVTLTATLQADYDDLTPSDVDLHGYLQGATVTFYDSLGNSLGSGITNSLGVVTCDVVLTETTTIYCSFLGTSDYQACNSNSVTVTVVSYLFYDDCSVDNTQLYTLQQIKGSANATLTFNSNEKAYLVHGTSTERAIYAFGDTILQNGMKISADIKIGGTNWYRNGFLGWFDPNNPQNNYVGGFVQGETYYSLREYVNNVEFMPENTRWSGVSTSDYNHHELVYQGGVLKYTLTNPNGLSKTITINERMSWIGSRIGLFIETNRYDLCYVKNIVVEAL